MEKEAFEITVWEIINNKTKPPGSLGLLEDLAHRICMIQKTITPILQDPTVVVFAADHGIADSKVSAFPKEVTYQMVLNFLNGGAAINVFTEQHNIRLLVVDAGVDGDFQEYLDRKNFIDLKVRKGTKNCLLESSMSSAEMNTALERGRWIAADCVSKNCNVIGFGEMGIGNTSISSLLMSSILDLPIEDCIGKGTGLDEEGLRRKSEVLKSVLERCKAQNLNFRDPLRVLQEMGGLEIAMMIGCMLASFEQNRILLIDGFISTTALLIASKIEKNILKNCIFTHVSDEKPHALLLDSMGGTPLLNLKLRLGEGTGCALAYPLLESALLFYKKMASFEEAGVSNRSDRF